MSIINDAIKKSRKEYKVTTVRSSEPVIRESGSRDGVTMIRPRPKTIGQPDKRWSYGVIISLVFVVLFLVSVILYRQASKANTVYVPVATLESAAIPISDINLIKDSSVVVKPENVLDLEGIVFDEAAGEKWAIINNNIFQEGDVILGGKVTLIMKDLVKIRKKNMREVVLKLR
ncbi:MAG: hypothetical protein ABH848_02185 [Candidatus Omnitrophota bacterium]